MYINCLCVYTVTITTTTTKLCHAAPKKINQPRFRVRCKRQWRQWPILGSETHECPPPYPSHGHTSLQVYNLYGQLQDRTDKKNYRTAQRDHSRTKNTQNFEKKTSGMWPLLFCCPILEYTTFFNGHAMTVWQCGIVLNSSRMW